MGFKDDWNAYIEMLGCIRGRWTSIGCTSVQLLTLTSNYILKFCEFD